MEKYFIISLIQSEAKKSSTRASGALSVCTAFNLPYVLDCDIVVSKFKLQSCYYIHFQTNSLGKGMNNPPSSNGLNSTTTVLLQGGFWY